MKLIIEKKDKKKKFTLSQGEHVQEFHNLKDLKSFCQENLESPEEIISIASSKRLKEGEVKEFTLDDLEVNKYFTLARSTFLEPKIMEYLGHNETEVEIGEVVYEKFSLINLDNKVYKIVSPGVGEAVDPDNPIQGILFQKLNPELESLYKVLSYKPEHNEYKDGDLGSLDGKVGAWSTINYLEIKGVKFLLKDFDYPVFRVRGDSEALFDSQDFRVPRYFTKGEFKTSQVEIKAFLPDPNIYTSMILPVNGVNHYFIVSAGDPILISIFNYDRPNLRDAERLIPKEELCVNSIQEALIVILKLTSPGLEEVSVKFLRRILS